MSEDKITEIPTQQNKNLKDLFFAPVDPSWHKICIEGKIIPKMLGREHDGKYEILFDDRCTFIFDTLGAAHTACSMAAAALAVGEGYSWFNASSKDHPFAPTVCMIDG